MENLLKKLTRNCISKGKIEYKLNRLYKNMTFSKSSHSRSGIQKHINRLEREVKNCDRTTNFCRKNGITTTL